MCEAGEIACRSAMVMQGYYGHPEETAKVLDEEGWYYTGDVGSVDEDGYLSIFDRKKDMIVRGGENIYAAEIERFLATHPEIQQAAVIGVPGEVTGERVRAYVKLTEGSELSRDRCGELLSGKDRQLQAAGGSALRRIVPVECTLESAEVQAARASHPGAAGRVGPVADLRELGLRATQRAWLVRGGMTPGAPRTRVAQRPHMSNHLVDAIAEMREATPSSGRVRCSIRALRLVRFSDTSAMRWKSLAKL